LGMPRVLHQPPFPSDRLHVVDYHLSLVGGAQLAPGDRYPWIDVSGKGSPAGRLPTGVEPRNLAVMQPGSGSRVKNWPVERFAELSEAIQRRGMAVLWVVGEAEEDMTLPLSARVMRSPTLTELASLLSACRLYVGNDSGITHLAAACGCPVVALFGPSDPRVWAPLCANVRIVSSDRACGPCHPRRDEHGRCTSSCMADITVGQVMDEVVSVL
jgi:ADP-heptose:LPS heptosyltransferase